MTEKITKNQALKYHTLSLNYLVDFKPRSKIWIEKDGEAVMGDWRVSLLEAIERTGSLTKAAEEMGVPYRSAWQKIKEAEVRLGIRLIETQSGGADGGSSHLTEAACDLLRRFRHLTQGLTELVDQRFKEAFG